MITLSIYESKYQKPIDPYEIFTCEKCGVGTCERAGRCPHCGGRMLNPKEFERQTDGIQSGAGFIIFGFLYLIFPAILVFSEKFRFADLFVKASSEAFMSVSNFTYLFALPLCFISTGIVMIIAKKDSLLIRLAIIGAGMTLFIALDFIFFPTLSR
jgi:hypothetical protein